MAQVFPTKANLMNTKKSLELAKLGYELMDRKRNILVREMMQMIDDAKEVQENINQVYARAFESLKKASLRLGDCSKFSQLLPVENGLSIDYRSVMGVELPVVELEKTKIDVSYFGFLQTDESFDEACVLFDEVKALTVQLVQIESSICSLADAVKKTQKRSNALSNIMIPNFESTVKYITEALDEKEREDFSRLKVTKKIKESKVVE